MTTLSLQPDASVGIDTFLYSGAPLNNYGIYVQIVVGGSTANKPERGLLYFDCSAIPSNATIVSAVLTLVQESQGDAAAHVINIHRALTQWFEGMKNGAAPGAGEDGSTWNLRNANGALAWGTAGGLAGTDYAAVATDSATCPNSSVPVRVDWTSLAADVQAWVNGSTTNYGWWLIGTDENAANSKKYFTSSDGTTSWNRPQLVVEYTVPETNISAAIYSTLIAGAGLTALLADGTAGVFEDHAPEEASYPLVIFNHQSGQWRETMGERTRFVDIVYQVKAVSSSAWPKEAETIDTQIDGLLHAASLSITGYGLIRCVRESDIQYSEVDGNQQFNHIGALYRIDLQKT